MQASTPFYKQILRRELTRRIERNPRYSLRAFAKAIAVDPAVLSRLLAGKRTLSLKLASRVAEQLALPPAERRLFLESVVEDQKQRALANVRPRAGAVFAAAGGDDERGFEHETVQELDAEIFRIIGDVYHYAILELTKLDDFSGDPRWIARRLGISVLETRLAVDRMLRLGLLQKDAKGRLVKTTAKLTTKDKTVTTPAHRKHQRQILEKAVHALENLPLEQRSMMGMTMAIDPDKLPLARQMIQEFMESLCAHLGSHKRSRVYQLGVSLFPLDT